MGKANDDEDNTEDDNAADGDALAGKLIIFRRKYKGCETIP